MQQFKRLFPHSEIQNIRLYYIIAFISEFYFIVGNWIYFWLRFMKYGELGLLDSVAFLFGFVMEVPAGAIADHIGRKKSIMLAFFLTSTGFITMGASSNNIQLIIGFLFAQLGWAFFSGAAEALAYDTLKEHKQEKDFDKVISSAQMLGLIALVCGATIGGYVADVYFRLPHLLTGIGFIFGLITSLFLHEPRIDSEKFSAAKYWNQITQGFKQLLLPSIKPFIPLILVTVGTAFMYSSGILQPSIAQSFGYDAKSVSWLGAIGLTIAAVAVKLVPWMRNHLSDRQGLQILAVVYVIGFFLFTQPLGFWLAGLVVICLASVRPLANSWISVVVNRELPSQYRATTLSAIEMLKKLPYILLGGFLGALIDADQLRNICFAVSGVIAIVVILNVVIKKKQAT